MHLHLAGGSLWPQDMGLKIAAPHLQGDIFDCGADIHLLPPACLASEGTPLSPYPLGSFAEEQPSDAASPVSLVQV